MRPGSKKERGEQKVLARSRQLLDNRESPEKYTSVYKLIAAFEITYLNVTGCQVIIKYQKGYYYFDHVKWNHRRLEGELIKLLQEEKHLTEMK